MMLALGVSGYGSHEGLGYTASMISRLSPDAAL